MADIVINPSVGKIDFFTVKGDQVSNTIKLIDSSTILFTGPLSASSISTGGGGAFVTSVQPTTNYLSKFTSNSTIANSLVYDNGSSIGIGTTSPSAKLDVRGALWVNYGVNGTGYVQTNSSDSDLQITTATNVTTLANTGTNAAMVLATNNTERLRIKNDGNVGIGTSSPQRKLHIEDGSVFIGDAAYISSAATNANGYRLDFDLTYDSTDSGTAANKIRMHSSSTWLGGFGISSNSLNYHSGYNHKFWITSTPSSYGNLAMIIEGSNGNVGIGSSSPAYTLDIYRSGNSYVQSYGTNEAGYFLRGQGGYLTISTYTTTARFGFSTSAYDSNTSQLVLQNGGNVGVGISSPTSKLHINSTTSGATVLKADGTSGTLFSVVDDLSDSLLSVNNSAGLPVLEVFADDRIVGGQYGQSDFVVRNNKVGIGTNNPQYKLDVTGSFALNMATADSNWPFLVSDNSTAGSRYSLPKLGTMGFNYADAYAQLQLAGSSGAYLDFASSLGDSNARLIYYSGGSSRLDLTYGFLTTITLNSTGVGIGTTGPTGDLHIYGAQPSFRIQSSVSGSMQFGQWDGTYNRIQSSARDFLLISTDATNLIFSTNTTERMRITSGGNVVIAYGGALVIPDSAGAYGSGNGSWIYNSGQTLTIGMRNTADGVIAFNTGASERMRIATDGNIGIGTTSPASKLNIVQGGTEGIYIDGASNYATLKLRYGGSQKAELVWYNTNTSLYLQNFVSNGNFYYYRAGTIDFSINGTGCVGIGTNNASSILQVGSGSSATATPTAIQLDNSYRNGVGGNTSLKFYLYRNGGETYGIGLNNSAGIEYHAGSSGGSTANHAFYTETTERVRIISNGNVGIGSSSPGGKLDVVYGGGTSNFGSTAGGNNFLWTRSSGGSIALWAGGAPGLLSTGDIRFITNQTYGSETYAVSAILTAAGNLGIGTTSPSYRIQVGTTGSLSDSIRIGTYLVAKNTRQYIGYTRDDSGLFESTGDGDGPTSVKAGVAGIRIVNTTGVLASSYADNSVQLLGHTFNGGSRVVLHANHDGNVGIGLSSPTATLHITASNADEVQIGSIGSDQIVGGRTGGSFGISTKTASNGNFIFTANSAIYLRTGGSNDRVFISSIGNVGIGTTSPLTKLQVTGGRSYFFSGDQYSVGLAQTAAQSNYTYLGTATDGTFYISETGGTARVTVQQGGNVGIGSTSPGYKLDVNGSARFVNNIYSAKAIISDSSGVGAVLEVYNTVATNATTAIIRQTTAGGNGNQDIGLLVDIQGAGDSDRIANFRYYDGSTYTSRMAVLRSGNVGIGTVNPSTKLDVVGSARLSSNLLSHKVAAYTTPYPGINSFGADATDSGITYYDTGKTLIAGDHRGIVWTGKHYIVTDCVANRAYFYSNNFDQIYNAYGVAYVSLPLVSGYASPHGAAWDGRYLWVIIFNNTTALKIIGYDIDTSGNATIIAESAAISVPYSYDIEYADGHLYFVTGGTLYIYKWNGTTIDQVAAIAGAAGTITGQGVTYDGSYLWVTQNGTEIYKVGLNGISVATITSGFPPNTTGWAWNGSNIVSFDYTTRKVYITNTKRLRIDTQNLALMGGNVGIGSTAPGALLNIRASTPTGTGTVTTGTNVLIDSNTNNYITFRNTADNGTYAGLVFLDNNVGGYIAFRNYTADGVLAGSDSMLYGAYQDHIFQNNYVNETLYNRTETMRIKQNGNVGIGTTTPGSKLEVYTNSTSNYITNKSDGADGSIQGIIFVGGIYNRAIITSINESTNGGSLAFQTYTGGNGSEKMRITGGGLVGIGTTSPNSALQVIGNADIGNSAADTGIVVRHGAGSSQYGRIRFYDSNGANINTIHSFPTAWQGGTLINSSAGAINLTGTNGITFGPWNTVDVAFASGGSNYFKGSVGIGTSSPAYKLEVVGTIAYKPSAGNDILIGDDATYGTAGTGRYVGIGFGGLANSANKIFAHNMGEDGLYICSATGRNISFRANGGATDHVVINTNGNLGIGSIAPAYKLDVNGTISVGGSPLASYSGNYNRIFEPAGNVAIYLGNATDPGNYYDNTSHVFRSRAGGTNYAIINTNGNLGIGTTSPLGKVHIYGLLRVGGAANEQTGIIALGNDANPVGTYGDNGIFRGGIGTLGSANYTNISSYQGIVFNVGNAGFGSQGTRMLIDVNGNVGINNTSPTTKLYVQGSSTIDNNQAWTAGTISECTNVAMALRITNIRTVVNRAVTIGAMSNSLPGLQSFDNSNNTAVSFLLNPFGGNIGIGIGSPTAKLHVNSTTSGDTLLRADGTSGTLFSVVDDLSDSLMSVNNSAGLPVLEVFSDDRVVMGQYNQNDLVVRNNKVGIGTNNATYNLDVQGNIGAEPYVQARFLNTNTSTPFGGILVNGTSQAHIRFLVGSTTWGGAGARQWQIRVGQGAGTDALSIYSWTTNTDVLYINNSGNVGIGTTSPGSKLDVNGTFRTAINNLTIFNDYIYVSPTNNNTLNSAYFANSIADMWINYRGYNDGQTQFRNFNVGDGKGTNIAWFDGTNRRMSINNGQSASYTLDVNGSIYTSAKLVQKSATQSLSGTTGCTIDLATAAVHILSLANGTTISSFTYNNRDNNPAVNTLLIVLKFAGTASITWTNVIWSNGVLPSLTATNGYADVIMLTSYQGGAGTPVWIGSVVAYALTSTNL